MKRILKYVFLITICFCFMSSVRAAITGYNSSVDAYIGKGDGDGGYENGYVGVKIGVYRSGTLIKSGVVTRTNIKSKVSKWTYALEPSINKFNQGSSYTNTSAITPSINSNLPSKYGAQLTFDNLRSALESNDYSLVKSLLTTIGATNLQSDDYIVIEPLIYIKQVKYSLAVYTCNFDAGGNGNLNETWSTYDWFQEQGDYYYNCRIYNPNAIVGITKDHKYQYVYGESYYLTAYEFYHLFYANSNSDQMQCYYIPPGKNEYIVGSFTNCYGEVLANACKGLFVNRDNITIGGIKIGKYSGSTSNSDARDCVKDKNCGGAVGIYKYSDIVKKAKINIKKVDTNERIISSTAKFGLYTSSTCTGTPLDQATTLYGWAFFEVVPKDSGSTYYIKELEAPAGYSLDNSCREVEMFPGQTKTLSVINNVTKTKITMKKVNQSGSVITSGVAKFGFFIDEDTCKSETNLLRDCTTNGGTCDIVVDGVGFLWYKELSAPIGYIKDSTCRYINYSGVDQEVNVVNARRPVTKLIIRKVNSIDKQPISSAAKFAIYSNNSCSGSPYQTNVEVIGEKEIEINTSLNSETTWFSIKELSSPNGYIGQQTCMPIELKIGDVTTKVVENTPSTCVGKFLDDISSRINLYNTYPENNNLLNFSIKDASQACSSIEFEQRDDTKCLSGIVGYYSKDNTNNLQNSYLYFNSNNVSAFTIRTNDSNGNNTFCSTNLEISNLLETDSFTAKAGMIYQPFQIYDSVAEAKLKVKCYTFDNSGELLNSEISLGKFSDYLSDLRLGDNQLQLLTPKYTDQSIKVNSGSEKVFTQQYIFPIIYLKKGTGEVSNIKCDNCIFAGTGIISKLNSNSVDWLDFSYKYKLSGDIYSTALPKNSYSCKFTSVPELVSNNKLNLEFRLIDVDKSFPGIKGNSRNKGIIWRLESKLPYLDLDTDDDGIFSAADYVALVQSNFNNNELVYDFNQNGTVDSSDMETLSNYILYRDTYGENLLKSRPNSYGRISYTDSKVEPKYVINLTPEDIIRIKKYKSTNGIKYDSYDYTCSDTSLTLEQLSNADVNNDGNIDKEDLKLLKSFSLSNNTGGYQDLEIIRIKYGDINLDGMINNKDLVALYKIINDATGYDTLQLLSADINGDGMVNNKDSVVFLKYLAGEYILPDDKIISNKTITIKRGDINLDGMINNKDLVALYKIVNGATGYDALQLLNADVNGDGLVNNKDVVKLNRYLGGTEVLPPDEIIYGTSIVTRERGDINSDGLINSIDVQLLENYLNNKNKDVCTNNVLKGLLDIITITG